MTQRDKRIYRNAIFLVLGLFLISKLFLPHEAKSDDTLVCSTTDDITQQLEKRGFISLLKMVNEKNVTQFIWITDKEVVITADKPGENEKVSCLIAKLTSPVFNAKTIETLHTVFSLKKD